MTTVLPSWANWLSLPASAVPPVNLGCTHRESGESSFLSAYCLKGHRGQTGCKPPPSFRVASWDVGVVLPEQKDQAAVGMGGHVTLDKIAA